MFCVPSLLAYGHDLNVFATVEAGAIHVRVYFTEEAPGADMPVKVLGPQNDVLATVTTDAEGRAIYRPTRPVRHVLIAEGPDGHRAQYTIAAGELSGLVGDGEDSVVVDDLDRRIDAAVSRQVRPLREQLDAHENAVRIRDIAGGVGYIVGIIGVLALVKSRKRGTA